MARSTLKIDRFEGGVNTKADRRDIDDNQAARIVDGYVATPGKLTLPGGPSAYSSELDKIHIQRSGWGLFTFMQDYDLVNDDGDLKGGVYFDYGDSAWPDPNQELIGNESVEYFLKLYDPTDQDLEESGDVDLPRLVVRENNNNIWTTLSSGLVLYSDRDNLNGPILPKVFKNHGNFRIIDSNFKQFGMFNRWLGIVKDTKFIGVNNLHYHSDNTPDWNETNAWLYTHADCKAPRSFSSVRHYREFDISSWGPNSTLQINGATTATASSITLEDSSGDQAGHNLEEMQAPVYLGIGLTDGFPDEIVKVKQCAGDSAVVSIIRGQLGTEAIAHADDTLVYLYFEGGIKGSRVQYGNFFDYSDHWGNTSNLAENNRYITYNESPGMASASDFTLQNDMVKLYSGDSNASISSHNISQTHVDNKDFGLLEMDSDEDVNWPGLGGHNVYSVGLSGDGTVWSGEHPGVHFVYEFQRQFPEAEEELDPSWFKGEKIRFYCSFIYDGKPGTFGAQESGLTDITPDGSAGKALKYNSHLNCSLKIKWTGINKNNTINANLSGTTTDSNQITTITDGSKINDLKKLFLNPRITGCRIYYSKSEETDSEKYLLLESWFDQEGGIRRVGNAEYMPWVSINYGNTSTTTRSWYCVSSKSDSFNKNAKQDLRMSEFRGKYDNGNDWDGFETDEGEILADTIIKHECFHFTEPPDVETYFDLNGHKGDDTNMLYKCSAEVNGQRFVGNVAYPVVWDASKKEQGFDQFFKGRVYGDRIVRSVSGQPDILVEDNYLSVLPNDGEEIVHMDSLNNQLLVFKQNTLIIIDVEVSTENGDVLSSISNTYKFKGITQPYHAVHLEQAIAFINKFGAFIYTGDDILDITTERLELKDWNWTDNKSIGFDAIDRNIIIIDDISSSTAINTGWIYSLDTGGWTQLHDKFNIAGEKSNFITNKEGHLMFTAFNDTNIDVSFPGITMHWVDKGAQKLIDLSSSTDDVGSGDIILLENTHISRADVTFKNLEFHSIRVPNEDDPNTVILYGADGALIDKGDLLLFEDDIIYFSDVDGNTKSIVFFGHHPYKIVDFGYQLLEFPNPVSEDNPFIDTQESAVHGIRRDIPQNQEQDMDNDMGWVQGSKDLKPFDSDTDSDDELEEEDDPVPGAPFGWPYYFVLEKQLDLGSDINSGGNSLDNFFTGTFNPDNETPVKRILNSSGTETPLVWRTYNANDRTRLTNGNSVTGNLYFDGEYRIQEMINDNLISLDIDYGEARYGWNEDLLKIYNFTRFTRYIPLPGEEWLENHQTPLGGDGHGNSDKDPEEFFQMSNIFFWSRNPQNSNGFDVITKDVDFGEASSTKKIYKVYITYTSPNIGNIILYHPRVRVVGIVTTPDGVFTVFPRVSKCTNYDQFYSNSFMGDNGLGEGILETFAPTQTDMSDTWHMDAVTQEDSKRATIVFDDPNNYLREALSFQVRLLNSAKKAAYNDPVVQDTNNNIENPTSEFFEVNDISIIYRVKKVK